MPMNDASLFSLIETNSATKEKSPTALRTISEAADALDVPQHVLRFWETKFSQIKPLKRNGGRRFYRPQDIDILQQIKHLLYSQGYTIKGAQKAIADYASIRSPLKEVVMMAPATVAFPPAHGNDNARADDVVAADAAEIDVLAELANALNDVDAEATDEIAQASVVALHAAPAVDVAALIRLRNDIADIRDALAQKLAA